MTENLKRKENESKYEYIKRITEIKRDKSIDIDYSEWSLLCFGQEYSSDVARRMFYGIEKLIEAIGNDNVTYITEDEILKELDIKKRELEKERIKIQTEKLELREMLRTDARNDMFIEQVINAFSELQLLEIPKKIINQEKKYALAAWADAHYGKEILIKGFNNEYVNLYNPKIFEDRMSQLLAHYIYTLNKEEIDVLYLFGLSDDIDGILRFSQLMSLKYGIVDSSIKFAYFMANWINELSKHVKIKLNTVWGNHSEIRPLASKSGEFANENMERVMYEFMKVLLRDNPNIEFCGCENIVHVEIGDITILATHGQNEKNLEQSIKDYTMIYNIRPNMFITGHLHSNSVGTVAKNEFGNIDYVQFPSICGVDEYAIKLKKSACAGGKMVVIQGKNRIHYDFVLE